MVPELQQKQCKDQLFLIAVGYWWHLCLTSLGLSQSLCSPKALNRAVAAEDLLHSAIGCQPEPTELINK